MSADLLVLENSRVSPATNRTADARSKPITPVSGDRSESQSIAGKSVGKKKSNPYYDQYCFVGETVSDVAKEYFWPHKSKPTILQSFQPSQSVAFLPPIKSQSQIIEDDDGNHPKGEFRYVHQHQIQRNSLAARRTDPPELKGSIRKIQEDVAHKVSQEMLQDEIEKRQRILMRKEKINEGFWRIKESRDALTHISRSAMPSMESTLGSKAHSHPKAGSIEAMLMTSTQGRHTHTLSLSKSDSKMRSSVSFEHAEGSSEKKAQGPASPPDAAPMSKDELHGKKGASPKERKRNSYNEVMFFDSCEYTETPEADATADRSGKLRMAHRNLSFQLDD